jgi:nitrogen regulatory protein P-II 1
MRAKKRKKEMKLITAYIQPHKLNDVKQSLLEADIGKMSVTNALGCGAQQGYEESFRGVKFEVNLLKKLKIEIAVNDDYVDPTVEAIINGAQTGQIGDGKIFVTDLVQCIRIRTKETGVKAIG